MKRLTFLFICIFSSLGIYAQNVQVTASAPKAVETGEQFEISYVVNAEASGIKPPVFRGLNFLGGPEQSSGSTVQIINGKMSQSVTSSYTYYFTANTPGVFKIDPATITVNGKNYASNALSIEVVKGSGNQTRGSTTDQQSTSNNSANGSGDDLFVRLLLDRNNVYQGEGVVATVKVYTKLNISNRGNFENLNLNDFFKQDIDIPQPKLERENINGQVYHTAVLEKFILFPQRSGAITIQSFTLPLVVQIPLRGRSRSPWDDFFGPQAQEVERKVTSLPVKLNVKPLPANKPASFKGAVGNFSYKAVFDRTNVKTNEAINLKITISGNGNIKTIESLDVKFPTDFETYDPKVNVNTNVTSAGVTGTKTFDYLVIPRHSGTFKIPPIEFTYFDSKTGQYRTASNGETVINVEKGSDEGTTTTVTGVNKEDVKFLGKDIQFIKTGMPKLQRIDVFMFGSIVFWLTFIISLILFIVLVLLMRKRIRESANIMLVRNKKANKVAHKRLKDAHLYMKENKKEEFYEYILKALWGYIGDKLSIPVAELSREKVSDLMDKKNIDLELTQKFLANIDTCEFARYAPFEGTHQMDIVYNDAIDVITRIEQKMR
jgi:uncharacterized membrane protein